MFVSTWKSSPVLNLPREIALQSNFPLWTQHAASASFPIPANPGHKKPTRLLHAAAGHGAVVTGMDLHAGFSPWYIALHQTNRVQSIKTLICKYFHYQERPCCRVQTVLQRMAGVCRFSPCSSSAVSTSSKVRTPTPPAGYTEVNSQDSAANCLMYLNRWKLGTQLFVRWHLQKDPLQMFSARAAVATTLMMCSAVTPKGTGHKSAAGCEGISDPRKMCSAGGRGRTPEIAACSFQLIRRPEPYKYSWPCHMQHAKAKDG